MAKANQVSLPCNLDDHACDATSALKKWGFKTISCFDKLSDKEKTSVVCHNLDTLKHLPSDIKTSIIKQCIKNKSDDYLGLDHLDLYVSRCKQSSSQDNYALKSNNLNPIRENNAGESSNQSSIKVNGFAGSSKQNRKQKKYIVDSREQKPIQENNVEKTSKKNYVQDDNIDESREQYSIRNNNIVDSSKQSSNQENHATYKDSRKTSRTKRACNEVVDYEEEEGNGTTSKKKSRKQKARARLIIVNPVHEIEPEMPEETKSKIEQLNGSNIKWLITKRLFPSDVSKNNNRFSMPLNQIDISFLSNEERGILDQKREIAVRLMGTSGELSGKFLKKWSMMKPTGKVIFTYNLKTGWYDDVVKANGLEAGQLVHVWSFREGLNLAFAIVKVDEKEM